MDLRDLEPARTDRRLSGEAAQAPSPGQRFLFACVIVQLGAMSLGWNLLALLLRWLLPRRIAGELGRAAISFMYRCCWASAERLGLMEVDASALDALRDEPGGLIVAANHPTMLDALLVVARLPRGVCVMKAELLRNLFLSRGARLAQYIRNDVGRGMVRDAVQTLREGNQLVLFPEGTRTVAAPINPFKPGITLIVAPRARADPGGRHRELLAVSDQGLAAPQGAAGAGAHPPAPRRALSPPRPTIARMLRRLERYFAEELRQ